ncbi:MAG: GNAT family N-acetyltransferase, partial [Candidatus Thorarchaeota archaeon]
MDDIESYTFEPGTPGMFEDYATLSNTVDSQDNPDHIDFTKEYFQSIFLSADFLLSRDMVQVLTGERNLIATGAIFTSDSSSIAKLKFQVHPRHRRRGLGTKVFEYLRDQGRLQGVSELVCYAPSFRPSTVDFLKERGLRFSHSIVKMQLEHKLPAKPALHPWGFKVRAMNIRSELNLWASIQNKLFQGISGYVSVT